MIRRSYPGDRKSGCDQTLVFPYRRINSVEAILKAFPRQKASIGSRWLKILASSSEGRDLIETEKSLALELILTWGNRGSNSLGFFVSLVLVTESTTAVDELPREG